MIINLVYLATPNKGGWPTYTAHLAHGLEKAGHDVLLWQQSKIRTESRMRPFGRGLEYRNATLDYILHVTRKQLVHITAADAKGAEAAAALLTAGASITVHDPTELKGPLLPALDNAKAPIVVIRKSMLDHLPGRSRYVPHPYQQMTGLARNAVRQAVAYSRLDWDKGTHHIVAANLLLPPGRRVQLFGAENRMYTHNKLNEIDPNWRQFYYGPWNTGSLWAGARLAASAHYVVDMSTIKGDGGGTQYTFLEAFDGGARLLLNEGWRVSKELDKVATYIDPETLGAFLDTDPPAPNRTQLGAAHKLLIHHDAARRAVETLGF